MAHQTQENAYPLSEAPAAASTTVAPEVQALIDQEVAAALAAHGVTPTAPTASALQTLGELAAGDLEHSTFAERLEELGARGYQAAVTAEQESPTLKTLVTVVGELLEKVG